MIKCQIYLLTAFIEMLMSAICVVLYSHNQMKCEHALMITYLLMGALFGSFIGVYVTIYHNHRPQHRLVGRRSAVYAFMDQLIELIYGSIVGAGLAVVLGVLIYNVLHVRWAVSI